MASSDLKFVAGQELMASWESSPGVHRYFASCCGSPLYKRDDSNPDELGFRLGTLDTDPHMKAELHFMAGSRAPWVGIADGLRQEDSGPPFGVRD